jgi:hypothetical protein
MHGAISPCNAPYTLFYDELHVNRHGIYHQCECLDCEIESRTQLPGLHFALRGREQRLRVDRPGLTMIDDRHHILHIVFREHAHRATRVKHGIILQSRGDTMYSRKLKRGTFNVSWMPTEMQKRRTSEIF